MSVEKRGDFAASVSSQRLGPTVDTGLFIAPKFVHMLTHTIQVWKEASPVNANSLQLQAESRASSHGNSDPR